MRILVADDEPLALRVLEATLTAWGHSVEAVADGDAAWEILESENPPQVAIIDWMMPGLNGLDLCRQIRARVDRPYVFLLLLSGRGEAEDLVTGMDAGADDYMVKPFDPRMLRVRLRAGMRILELQSELITTREALRDQATNDA